MPDCLCIVVLYCIALYCIVVVIRPTAFHFITVQALIDHLPNWSNCFTKTVMADAGGQNDVYNPYSAAFVDA